MGQRYWYGRELQWIAGMEGAVRTVQLLPEPVTLNKEGNTADPK
jgi:hypothetical protein